MTWKEFEQQAKFFGEGSQIYTNEDSQTAAVLDMSGNFLTEEIHITDFDSIPFCKD